jgi:hypothetical protein
LLNEQECKERDAQEEKQINRRPYLHLRSYAVFSHGSGNSKACRCFTTLRLAKWLQRARVSAPNLRSICYDKTKRQWQPFFPRYATDQVLQKNEQIVQ